MAASGHFQTILSASRRTDIPAFYMDWFMAGIRQGFFEVVNPYNQHRRRVPARPDEIHSIVFWSKDFGPFLKGNFDKQLGRAGYRLFFNFTINAPSTDLEPHVPALADRLAQAAELARRHGAAAVTWRCDPICFVRTGGKMTVHPSMEALEALAASLADTGIDRCVTSFVDLYRKVKQRLPSSGVDLVDPPLPAKCEVLLAMAASLRRRNIRLNACCEKEILDALPMTAGIGPGDCIPGHLLASLYGPGFKRQKDSGQRRKHGCTCNISVDIGSYRQQPCYHNCLFCYANPQKPARHTLKAIGSPCTSDR
jgi:hypothetical protein